LQRIRNGQKTLQWWVYQYFVGNVSYLNAEHIAAAEQRISTVKVVILINHQII